MEFNWPQFRKLGFPKIIFRTLNLELEGFKTRVWEFLPINYWGAIPNWGRVGRKPLAGKFLKGALNWEEEDLFLVFRESERERGISKEGKKSKIDRTLSIEMERDFDSLNVSVSAGILIYRMRDGLK